jgi:outer membrane protein OmpA-like peptidoglycan-associated protein
MQDTARIQFFMNFFFFEKLRSNTQPATVKERERIALLAVCKCRVALTCKDIECYSGITFCLSFFRLNESRACCTMSEKNDASRKEKAAKTKRKIEDKSPLTRTFAAMRKSRNSDQQASSSGGSLLQRHRQNTGEAGSPPDQTFANPTHDLDFSAIPAMRTASGQPIQANLSVNAPGDQYEREADQVADEVMRMPDPAQNIQTSGTLNPTASRLPLISRLQAGDGSGAFEASPEVEERIDQMRGGGQPLPKSERNFFESRMGYDFSSVRVHTDANAVQASHDIQAHAFTIGNDIAFSEGAYQPGTEAGRRLLAHELTHVVQQTGDTHRQDIQRAIDPSYEVTHGRFDVNATPGGPNLPITIQFHPNENAPYSNQIGLIQIVKLTDADGKDVEPQSLPAARAGSLRTTEDAAAGVEGGFFTDVLHNDAPASGGAGTDAPAGSDLPPQYPFGNGPAQPDQPAPGLSRPNSGGAGGQIIGYKRSNDPADIKAAELTDAPGFATANPANPDLNFEFETVAKGEDSQTIYGALKWDFEIRGGVAVNEDASVDDSQSATFDAALELHRDFYVHEPVIFYFDFDSDTLSAEETNKIDTFLNYLNRFPDVKVSSTGFADRRGNVDYNLDLSLRRAEAVVQALKDKGVSDTQIEEITVGGGETETFTQDADTNPDQDAEANRRGNRRVVLTFRHEPGSGAGAGGAGGGGAP